MKQMQDYKIIEEIGHGMVSTSYKIEDKNSNQSVLKEIECVDMLQCTAVLNELKLYQTINHRFICKINEVFTKWDYKHQSALVCYVMKFYENGNLKMHLNKLRTAKEKVPIVDVQRWYAMIIEAMYYLYEYKLLHRNLKPSSLYIANHSINSINGNSELHICNFGTKTIMRDANMKTRIHPGEFDYTAPEIIDVQSYNDKADLWSIGAIMLNICTTGIYDAKEFNAKLVDCKHNDEILNETLIKIENTYNSADLINLLRDLLQRNKHKRSDYKTLINTPFTRKCLELIDSDLVKDYGTNLEINSDVPLPNLLNYETLMKFVEDNADYENRVQEAMLKISELIDENGFNLPNDSQFALLLKLLNRYMEDIKIQIAIMKIFERSLKLLAIDSYNSNVQNQENPYLSDSFMQKIVFSLIKHRNSSELQIEIMKVLIQLANFDSVAPYLAKHAVIKYLIQSIDRFIDDPTLCAYICKALWCLATHEIILNTFSNLNCVAHLRKVLLAHSTDTFCIEMACNTVVALCMKEAIVSNEELSVDVTSAILLALRQNYSSANVVISSCMSLASMINLFEECAFRFISTPKLTERDKEGLDGISLLKRAYDIHKGHNEVVERICNVFKALCNYDEMVIELRSIKLDETFLMDVKTDFRDAQLIINICDKIFYRLKSGFKQNTQSIQ